MSNLSFQADKVICMYTGLHNLAYNKTTHQTGLRKGKPKFRSSMAIDGNIKTCAKTDRRSNPMWTIDLGAPAIVSGITLKRLGPGEYQVYSHFVYLSFSLLPFSINLRLLPISSTPILSTPTSINVFKNTS